MQLSDIPFIKNDCYWSVTATNDYEKDEKTVREYFSLFIDAFASGIITENIATQIAKDCRKDQTYMGLIFMNIYAKIALMLIEKQNEESCDEQQYDTVFELYVNTWNKLHKVKQSLIN